MVVVNGLDTNNQSDRASLRQQGYYIDNSGAYAPGAGSRVGDTFSGSQATKNEAPSPTQLPVINGTPVSPSNGGTGPAAPAIMYRTDPLYAQYFGPGTPGYSSTSGQANAAPLPADSNQQSLTDYLNQSGTPVGPTGAPMPAQAAAKAAPAPAPAAQIAGAAPTAVATDTAAAANQPANDAWAAGIAAANPSGTGFGPYATVDAPELRVQGRYVENGQIIEKSVDQFGNPYYKTVGAAPTTEPAATVPAPAGAPATAAAAPAQPAANQPTTPPAPGSAVTPGPDDPTKGGTLIPIISADGKNVSYIPQQLYLDHKADIDAQAAAAAKSLQFTQGIDQGELDVKRLVATYTNEYQQALIAGNTAALAQSMAIEKMRDDLQQQTIDLNKVIQTQTAAYQQQQVDLQRSGQAQTNSLEQEKLALARQQARGRRLPAVRYA